MLKLIVCEFAKLKRKKFILLVVLSSFLFPIPVAVLMTMPQTAGRYESQTQVFNGYFQFVMGYGVELLLPCVIGVIAAMLFFMERDNDTFKNLRVIPVTGTQMIFAKIIVLFLAGMVFSISSTFAAVLCGSVVAEVNGLAYKLLVAAEMGIFITAGTLPSLFFSAGLTFFQFSCVCSTVC